MPDTQDYDGKRYYLRDAPHGEDGCMGCYFNRGAICDSVGQAPSCSPMGRTDGRSVIFVGPPTEIPTFSAIEPADLKPIEGYIDSPVIGKIIRAVESRIELADINHTRAVEVLVAEIRRLREFIHAKAR